jgi:hypothetical protein
MAALPVLVAEDDDRLGKGGVFSRKEGPAEKGANAEDVEEARGNDAGVDSLRWPVPHEREGHRMVLDERLERGARPPIGFELGVGEPERREVGAAGGRALFQEDHAGRLGVGERPQQHVFDDAEDGGVDADSEGERRDRDEKEASRAAERAEGVAQVLAQGIDERESAESAHVLLGARDPAERPLGGVARLDGIHPSLDVLPDLHLQMEEELLVELPLEPPPFRQGAEALEEHPAQLVWRMRATAPARRVQFSVSSLSWRLPAAVRR